MRNNIFCSFEKYNRMVESIGYKGWKVKIDPIGKYPGQLDFRYRYMIERINSEEDITNGARDSKTLMPTHFKSKNLQIFKGFDNLMDFRVQCTRKEITDQLKETVDKYGTTEP